MSSLPQLESLELRRLLSSSLVADFNGVFPTNAVQIDGISYFTADEGSNGYELWKSDGTIAGTVLVKDLIAGKADSQLTMAGELDGALLFFSRQDDGALSLWRSDGTNAGTSKLKDIGHQDSRAKLIFDVVDDQLFFVSHGGPADAHVRLWRSDGTTAGTSSLATLHDGPDYNCVEQWHVIGDRIVIPTGGDDLWATDGTVAGTLEIAHTIAPSESTINITPGNFVAMGDHVYFATETQPNTVLWKTDGTLAGTMSIKNFSGATNLQRFVVANDRVLFQVSGREIDESQVWRTDGTEAGTEPFAAIEGRLGTPIQLDDAAVFLVNNDVSHAGFGPFQLSLWRSDGTVDGTYMVKDLQRDTAGMSSVAIVDGIAFFLLDARSPGSFVRDQRELWRTDGTASGTSLVEDLSRFKRTDLDEEMRRLNDQGGIPMTLDDADRDSILLSNADGRLAVKTPGDTLVFDPTTMTAPIGPAHGYSRLDDDGTVRVFGTLNQDDIRIYLGPDDPSRLVVNLNGERKSFDVNDVARVRVYGYGGNDTISVLEKYGRLNKRLAVWGGDGNDRIFTGSGRDSIWGESGNDFVNSGRGDDTIAGGSGEDSVNGAQGTDVVSGGGGRDRIDGGFGTDVIFGEKVFEIFYNGKKQQDSADLAELVFG